jgi:hypothetical protein
MREVSVRAGRTRDGTPAAPDRLGDEHHCRDRRARLEEKVRRGYHHRRGGRYDSEEDRSPSPEPPGPRAFSRAIRVKFIVRTSNGSVAKHEQLPSIIDGQLKYLLQPTC